LLRGVRQGHGELESADIHLPDAVKTRPVHPLHPATLSGPLEVLRLGLVRDHEHTDAPGLVSQTPKAEDRPHEDAHVRITRWPAETPPAHPRRTGSPPSSADPGNRERIARQSLR